MTEALTPELRDVVDRMQLHELLAEYALAIDTMDWGLLRTLFTDDAEVDYSRAQGISGGIEPIIDWLATIITPDTYAKTQHFITNVRLVLRGDEAEGRAYYFNPDLPRDAETGDVGLTQLGGDYELTFARSDGRWRIRHLLARVVWVQQCELVAPSTPLS